MNAYAFTRLYWRSSTIAVLALGVPPLIGLYRALTLVEKHLGFEAWYFPNSANALLMALPLLSGFLVGATIVEVYNGRFSWTLPGVRGDFLAAAVTCGAVTATGAAWLHHLANGAMSLVPAFSLAALWFASMVHAQVGPGGSVTRSRLGLMAVAVLTVNGMVSLGVSHPLLIGVLALAGSAAAVNRAHSADNIRGLTSSPRRSLKSAFTMYSDTRHRGELLAQRRPGGREWTHTYLADDTLGWVRALEYEMAGDSRFGVYQRPMALAAGAVATCAFLASTQMWDEPTLTEGLRSWLRGLYELNLLIDVDTGEALQESSMVWRVMSFIIAVWGLECALPLNSVSERLADLRPRFLYPLSRRQRGQVNFWSCLRANTRFVGMSFMAFYATALLSGLALHKGFCWSAVPSGVFPLTLLFLLTPVVQALGICYKPRLMAIHSVTLQKVVAFAIGFSLAALIVLGSTRWVALSSQYSHLVQVTVVAAAALTIHYALWRWLQRHFARADLTY